MKKKIILFTALLLSFFVVKAQFNVSGSAKTLPPSKVSLGLTPFYMLPMKNSKLHSSAVGANTILGFGLNEGVDFRIRFGMLNAKPIDNPADTSQNLFYLAANTEFQLITTGKRHGPGFGLSLTLGVHSWQTLAGFDGTVNMSYRFSRKFYIYTGFDIDYNNELELGDTGRMERIFGLYYWVPAGIVVRPNERLSLILEGSVPISQNTAYYTGIGFEVTIN